MGTLCWGRGTLRSQTCKGDQRPRTCDEGKGRQQCWDSTSTLTPGLGGESWRPYSHCCLEPVLASLPLMFKLTCLFPASLASLTRPRAQDREALGWLWVCTVFSVNGMPRFSQVPEFQTMLKEGKRKLIATEASSRQCYYLWLPGHVRVSPSRKGQGMVNMPTPGETCALGRDDQSAANCPSLSLLILKFRT